MAKILKGAIIWNEHPSNIINIGSYIMFKKKVKEHVIYSLKKIFHTYTVS